MDQNNSNISITSVDFLPWSNSEKKKLSFLYALVVPSHHSKMAALEQVHDCVNKDRTRHRKSWLWKWHTNYKADSLQETGQTNFVTAEETRTLVTSHVSYCGGVRYISLGYLRYWLIIDILTKNRPDLSSERADPSGTVLARTSKYNKLQNRSLVREGRPQRYCAGKD
jgi:hypothetical protein